MTHIFDQQAPGIMRGLMQEFDLSVEDAAAICGNLGHESGGFRFLQEKKPLVPGSRGGWGWAQWTGPRRRAFEKWVGLKGLDPASHEANFGYLCLELKGSEKGAIPAVKAAPTLAAKVKAFELAFERASVNHKHYPARNKWAKRALAAYNGTLDRIAEKAIDQIKPSRNTTPAAKARRWAEEDLPEFEVKAIQSRLRELGYFQVGKVDGKWAGSTASAITALQFDRGITVDGHWGPETKAELAKDIPRPISSERASTTADDLRNQGSTIIKHNDGVKDTSFWGAIIGAIVSIPAAMVQYAGQAIDTLSPLYSFFEAIPIWLLFIAFAAICLYFYYQSQKVENSRVKAERMALHNGEPEPAPTPEEEDDQ